MRTLALISLSLCLASAAAQTQELREVVVSGKRPIKETGIVKTTFDSLALKENIALSMADVLSFNSSVFVKSYGRATLSTVAFRGTSPSHTQVTWNGMPLTNPMLGMTDFSTIPSYFIDKAALLHGNSSLGESSGGLGGLVQLSTTPVAPEGLKVQYVQGIGSFSTFDEFARVSYGNARWRSSTRVVYSSSANDYTYINHDKKENIYDDNHNIIGQYHPRERNRSGAFKDLHALQDVFYRDGDNSIGLSAWYTHSDRELPMLTTDYGDERSFENRQREQTLRAVASWEHFAPKWRSTVRAGYVYAQTRYDYRREAAEGVMNTMTRARSYVNSYYGRADGEYSPSRRWNFAVSLSARQHTVRSHDRSVATAGGGNATVGYDAERAELAASATGRWRPTDRTGISLVLREEINAGHTAPLMPSLAAEAELWPAANLTARASIARNYRFPTVNDMYFLPGGNPDLRPEHGFSYDAGLSFETGRTGLYRLTGSAGWFDSRIDDWIMWLPTPKGFFSPRNVMRVHAHGIETRAALALFPRIVPVDAVGQRRRARQRRRQLRGQAAAIRAAALGIGHAARHMARLERALQVVPLLAALHHVEQRTQPHGLSARLLHEQHRAGQGAAPAPCRPVGEAGRKQSFQRGLSVGALAPHARHQFRALHRYHAPLLTCFCHTAGPR